MTTPFFSTLLGSSLLGVFIGSILNVCLNSWKTEKSSFWTSRCPRCDERLFLHYRVYVFGIFSSAPKCSASNKLKTWQYPLIEGVTALLFGLSYIYFQAKLSLLVASFLFVSFMVLFVVSDINWNLLPHPFTNLFISCGLLASNGGQISLSNSFRVITDFLFLGFILYGMNQIIPNGLGGGDIKMGAALAIWLGLSKSLLALLIAFGFGSLVVIPLVLTKTMTRKSMIPFGPFLASGSILIWFWPEFLNRIGLAI